MLCGKFTVRNTGVFGYHHVYGDDLTTPHRDEGATLGDIITFHVDGQIAAVENPPVWGGDGAIVNVDLSAKPLKIVPKLTSLFQNYPNPFNPETWFPFQLTRESNVTIWIYNLKGEIVRTLFLGKQQPGFYIDKGSAAYWDGRNDAGENVTSGVYFYLLRAGDFNSIRKMVVVK